MSRVNVQFYAPVWAADMVAYVMVPEAGLEPARPRGHRILNPTCLPISPLWHFGCPEYDRGGSHLPMFGVVRWRVRDYNSGFLGVNWFVKVLPKGVYFLFRCSCGTVVDFCPEVAMRRNFLYSSAPI
jgi:hypothetical protein